MPRLGYKKSRNGCQKCRERRIKCDEKRPCTACQRHGIPCSLMDASSVSSTAPAKTRRPRDGSESRYSSPGVTPATPATPSTPARSSSGTPHPALPEIETRAPTPPINELSLYNDDWAMDLRLMHNFTTKSYLTLPRANEVGHVWQNQVVETALNHRFLLHQILAFSAFHLAYTEPEQRHHYYCVGMQHQRQGVRDMRSILGQLNPENCHALFMSASFLVLGSFGALTIEAQDVDSQRPAVDDVVELFILLKGMSTVLDSWHHIIHLGPFAELFEYTGNSGPMMLFVDPDADTWLRQLRSMLDMHLADDPFVAKLVNEQIALLTNVSQHAVITSPEPDMRFIMYWPVNVSDSFIQLLRERVPAALVILSHYCVAVYSTESRTWFTRGWGPNLLRAIDAILPPTWRDMIEWPLSRVPLGVSGYPPGKASS